MTIHSVADRQAYLKLLPTLREGDCVQVGSFSVIAANAAELFEAAAELESRGAELISLGEEIDTRNEGGKLSLLCAARCTPWTARSRRGGARASNGRRKRAATADASPSPSTRGCSIPSWRSGRAARSRRATPWPGWISSRTPFTAA